MNMEGLHCASLISHLEGGHRLALPDNFYELVLPSLEKRVSALEIKVGIATPPPFEESTWNGVVWRLWRVQHQSPTVHQLHQTFPAGRTEENSRMWKDDMNMANLRRVVDALSPELPLLATSPPPRTTQGDDVEGEKMTKEEEDGDDGMGALVQKLAYMAGRRRMPFTHGPMTMAMAYAYVAQLSFSGGDPFFHHRPPMAPFPPNSGRPIPGCLQPPPGYFQSRSYPQAEQKPYRYAGGNKCKPKPSLSRGRETPGWRGSTTASVVIHPMNGGLSSKFGWLKKLLFWRRNRSSSRSIMSSSSGSSDSIVD